MTENDLRTEVATREKGSGSNDGSPRRRGWPAIVGPAVIAAVIYCALAVLLYWPTSPFDTRHVVGPCACGDVVQQVWFLRWAAFAVAHGHDPLFSHYLNAPSGVNLGVNTSMPLLGVLAWPLIHFSNSVAAFNFLFRLGLASSALSMFLVLRKYVRSPAAAFVGGLLFGFSPYMLAEGSLHVFLIFLPFLPPLIPLVDRWLIRADRNPYHCGGLIGLLMGLEMLISAELVAAFLIFIVIALVPIAIRHHDLVRSRLTALGRGLAAAAIAGVIVGGYVPWMLLAGPQRPNGPPHKVGSLDRYHADLLSLIVPSRPQLLRPSLLHGVGEQFVRGIAHENGFYLGIPLLAVLIAATVWLRKSALVLGLATLGVVSFVLGLGTHLTMANHPTNVPLPFVAISRTPLLEEIGPTRFALSIQLSAAVLLALSLDRVLQRTASERAAQGRGTRYGLRRAGWVGLALVLLVPLLPPGFVHSAPVRIPRYFSSNAVEEIPRDALTLAYPFPFYSANDPMLWQAARDMRFRLVGGEVFVPSPTGESVNYPHGGLPDGLWYVLRRPASSDSEHPLGRGWRAPRPATRIRLVVALRVYVISHKIRTMIVLADNRQGRWVAGLTTSTFGPPTSVHGRLLVWVNPVG